MGYLNAARKHLSLQRRNLPRLARHGAAAVLALAVATQWGCSSQQWAETQDGFAKGGKIIGDYLNLRNSFLNPSEVGRFDKAQPFGEARFVQLPILDTIDVVDQPVDHWANATDVTAADIQTKSEEYVFGVGDTVGVSIYELLAPGASYDRNSQITETGSINIQSLGNIPVVGLTPTQLEEKLKQITVDKGLIAPAGNGNPGPQVTVTLLGSRQRIFSILGAVGATGTYTIISNDFRLLDALALAHDVQVQPGMDYIYVIRQGLPAEKPVTSALTAPATTRADNPGHDIDDILHSTSGPRTLPGTTTDSAPATAPATDSMPAKPGARGPAMEDGPQMVRELPVGLKDGFPHAMVVSPPLRHVGTVNELDTALDATAPAPATSPATESTAPSTISAPAPVATTHDSDLDTALKHNTGQMIFVDGKLVELPAKATTQSSGAIVMAPQTGPNTTSTSGAGPLEPPTTDNGTDQVQTQRVIRVPIQALREGVSRYNIIIRPGDVINIPGADPGEFYLMGHVARPGVYTLTGRKVTLKQAVAAAGNFDSLAIPRRCELIRRVGPDQEVTIQVNMQSIFDGEQPDLFLKPNDVLNVGTDLIGTLLAITRNGYRASYGWGFVYDKNLDGTNNGQ